MRLLLLLSALSLLLPSAARAEEDAAQADEDTQVCAPLPEAAPRIREALAAPAGPAGATVLLVLPRTGLSDLDEPSSILAEGVSIVESFWSPVLCASISRLRGPPGLPAGSLVPGLPDSGSVVPDDTYFTSASVPGAEEEDSLHGPDPYRPLQYALDELGVDAARPVSTGAGTRIAILDSTPDTTHPDLARVEIAARIVDERPAQHGTMVAGILAAEPDNRVGIRGVAPDARVMAIPVCVPDPSERGDACALYDVLRGLDAAWELRAHVVNLSLAGPTNPLLQAAVDRLDQLGVTLIAAAGNDGGSGALYPAAYSSVIGVGATGRGGAPYPAGNVGPGLELTAPGVDIVSTAPGGGFAFGDGTSLATAHVSGVLAVLASASGKLALARQTLLLEAHRHTRADGRVGVLPQLCEMLRILERPCPAP